MENVTIVILVVFLDSSQENIERHAKKLEKLKL